MGRRITGRRTEERRVAKRYLKLIDELRMQARTRAAANRTMKVAPDAAESTLEWKAADVIQELVGTIPEKES